MVRIRLSRTGGKRQASYRLVAMDKEDPRDGRCLENLGHYNPRTEPFTFNVHEDRIFDWMQKGAQPTESVKKLLESTGVMGRYERLKAGEDLNSLLAEAGAASSARNTSVKTRRS